MKIFAVAALATIVAERTEAPNAPQTCLSFNTLNERENGMFLNYGLHPRKNHKGETEYISKIATCHFQRILQTIAEQQINRAIWFAGVRGQGSHEVEQRFRDIIFQWAILTGEHRNYERQDEQLNCGIDGAYQVSKYTTKRGWIDKCDWWCGLSNPIENMGEESMKENAKLVIRRTLNVILQIVNELYARNHVYKHGNDKDDKYRLKYCARIDRKAHYEQGPGNFRNRLGEKCSNSDKCGQAVRFIYREAAKFEKLVGDIPELDSYQRSWTEDKDH